MYAQQSVRHHLSLNRLFERQPRPPSDPGFGSYWTVNLDAPPGTKRPRKRGGRSNKTEYSENGPTPGLGPVLPTVIIIVVSKLGSGGSCCVSGATYSRSRKEFLDQNLQDLERGCYNRVLIRS